MRIGWVGQCKHAARPAVMLACLFLAAAQACSLNPQPIPPGADPQATAGGSADASVGSKSRDDGGTTSNGPDAGAGVDGDGAPPITDSDASAQADVAAPFVDAGTDGEVGDATADAPADAPDDSPLDALVE